MCYTGQGHTGHAQELQRAWPQHVATRRLDAATRLRSQEVDNIFDELHVLREAAVVLLVLQQHAAEGGAVDGVGGACVVD